MHIPGSKVRPASPSKLSAPPCAYRILFRFLPSTGSSSSKIVPLLGAVGSASKIGPKCDTSSEKMPAGIPSVGEKTIPMLRNVILLLAEF